MKKTSLAEKNRKNNNKSTDAKVIGIKGSAEDTNEGLDYQKKEKAAVPSRVGKKTTKLEVAKKKKGGSLSSGATKRVVEKDHNLSELVFKYPQTAEVLMDWGLHCIGCGAMAYDTIEMGAKIHGFTDEEIDELVDRINEVIKFGE